MTKVMKIDLTDNDDDSSSLEEIDYLSEAKKHYFNAVDYPSVTSHVNNAIAAALIALAESSQKGE
jgi:hypothetical protein